MNSYIIIPGTDIKLLENSIVILNRLPNTKWIVKQGYYTYDGSKKKGWYLCSIPSKTIMPLFTEDLVTLTILSGNDTEPIGPGPDPFPPHPCPPFPPFPPGPFPPLPPGPPEPPVPKPVIFTQDDKDIIDRAMITVQDLEERDKLSSSDLINGRIVRVNTTENGVDYFEWDSDSQSWKQAELGYRYLTREEIENRLASCIVDVVYSDSRGALVISDYTGTLKEVGLDGLVHSVTYDNYELRIPIFGKEDLVVPIPKDSSLRAAWFDPHYTFPDGSVKPAIVFEVVDEEGSRLVPMDASDLYNILHGSSTDSIRVIVNNEEGEITANIRIDDSSDNLLSVTENGLLVDISEVRRAIDTLSGRVDEIERNLVGEGSPDKVVLSTEKGVTRSDYELGGNILSETGSNLIATETAVKEAISWKPILSINN